MTKPKFTYGDCIRRKSGGPIETVHDMNETAYYHGALHGAPLTP
jgi:uncharacterized protein YodC (DUF2158 family)